MPIALYRRCWLAMHRETTPRQALIDQLQVEKKVSFYFLNDSFQRADSEYPTLTTLRWAKMHLFRI